MTSPPDDSKPAEGPSEGRVPLDSEAIGLSTVPRRRIVVGGDPQTGSSSPPAGEPQEEGMAEAPRKHPPSAPPPAQLKRRRNQLSDTGYSEVPTQGEERVMPAAIPRAPRMPRIEEEVVVSRGAAATASKASRALREALGSSELGVSDPSSEAVRGDGGAERTAGRQGAAIIGTTALKRSPNDAIGAHTLIGGPSGNIGGPSGNIGGPSGNGRSDTARSAADLLRGASIGTEAGDGEPNQAGPADSSPLTDGYFPPNSYSPSGTLQSMSAVNPDMATIPRAGFVRTLTGASYLPAGARAALEQAARESDRISRSSAPPVSRGFQSERTMIGLPKNETSPVPVPLRPSPPPVVLSDEKVQALTDAISAAAQGQLRESEIPVPSERLEAAVLQQLGQLDEALKSSPRMPHLGRTLLEHGGMEAARGEMDGSESAPGSSSVDAPSPGSVPSQSALPGDMGHFGPSGLPTVGRYEILARLRSGGMGSVYMCRLSGNAGFRRLFAMKVLHAHLTHDAEALESFQREARVLGSVHHPNVVGVVDFGSEREPYIVIEYVEGGSLHELFRATAGTRDPKLVLTVVLDVLEGLAASHSARDEEGELLGLVHCDVCPQNILVGVDGAARITDFGIAQTRESLLTPEQLRGKPRFLAPERFVGTHVDARVDVFSLGVVLYAGLTGVEPFAGEAAEETRWNISHKTPPAPSTVGFRPPPSLDWLVLKALSKDPAGRFQSAEEMASQLRRIAEREGLLASRNEVAEWVRTTLAPSLAARRVAARRGTVMASGRPPSNTPPRVQSVEAERAFHKSSAPPPSSAENTAPIPSQYGEFGEGTDVLSRGSQAAAASKRVLWLTAALCVGILLWGILAPQSLASWFSVEPPTGAQLGDPAETGVDAKPAVPEPERVVVPSLGPSFDAPDDKPADPSRREDAP